MVGSKLGAQWLWGSCRSVQGIRSCSFYIYSVDSENSMTEPWHWNETGDTAYFSTRRGTGYRVCFFHVPAYAAPEGVPTWSVSFVLQKDNSVKVTGAGSAHEVFKTVRMIIVEFSKKQPGRGLCFSADESSDTRVSLYARFSKLLASQLQMTVQERTRFDTNQIVYWLAPRHAL